MRRELTLFCLPHAGGSGSVFRDWQAVAPDGLRLVPLTLPGRAHRYREPLHQRLAPLVRDISQVIKAQSNGPFGIIGHSMGALLAYCVAQRLAQFAQPGPEMLCLACVNPPHLHSANPPLHALADDALIARLRGLGGIPHEVLDTPEILALMRPVIRADLEACESFRLTAPVPVAARITVISMEGDDLATPAHMAQWARYTHGQFAHHTFPGGHFAIHQNRERILQLIAS